MPAEKSTEPKLTEAARKTTAALEGLQSRLRPGPVETSSADDLGRELEQYFAAAPGKPAGAGDEMLDRVIDGVADRILRSWEDSRGQLSADLKSAVIERLIERVTDRLGKAPR